MKYILIILIIIISGLFLGGCTTLSNDEVIKEINKCKEQKLNYTIAGEFMITDTVWKVTCY